MDFNQNLEGLVYDGTNMPAKHHMVMPVFELQGANYTPIAGRTMEAFELANEYAARHEGGVVMSLRDVIMDRLEAPEDHPLWMGSYTTATSECSFTDEREVFYGGGEAVLTVQMYDTLALAQSPRNFTQDGMMLLLDYKTLGPRITNGMYDLFLESREETSIYNHYAKIEVADTPEAMYMMRLSNINKKQKDEYDRKASKLSASHTIRVTQPYIKLSSIIIDLTKIHHSFLRIGDAGHGWIGNHYMGGKARFLVKW